MPRSCCAACPTGRGPDRPGGLTLDLTATDHRSEVGRRLAELLSLHRRRLRHRPPHPDRLDHGLALYPGRGCVWLARVRLLVPAARSTVLRAVSARGCSMARQCPLARLPVSGPSRAVCWARVATAACLHPRPHLRPLPDPRLVRDIRAPSVVGRACPNVFLGPGRRSGRCRPKGLRSVVATTERGVVAALPGSAWNLARRVT